MSLLVNPSLIAAAIPHGAAASQAARKTDAGAYLAAMREAASPAAQAKSAAPPAVAAEFAREAPFGVERPRYQRPGWLVDIKV